MLNVVQDDAIIWRYMDWEKLFDLVTTRTLYFSVCGKLGDPYEGYYPDNNALQWVTDSKSNSNEMNKAFYDTRLRAILENGKYNEDFTRKNVYSSCWSKNDHESYLFWQSYSPGKFGVAIKTTKGKLSKSLGVYSNIIRINPVRYRRGTVSSH